MASPPSAGKPLPRDSWPWRQGTANEAGLAFYGVRGYFVWPLPDDFEWGTGHANRFGVVRIDYAMQRRIPKASTRRYADLIRAEAVGRLR